MHADVRWLSTGKIFSRVFELRNELVEFPQSKKPNWAQLFLDVNWVATLAYLADIFSILNDLNASMQGRMVSCFTIADKIEGQKRKLEAWKSRIPKDCYDMFPNLATFIADAGDELNVTSIKNVIHEHLANLTERFEFYFPTEEDPRKENGWVRNPYCNTPNPGPPTCVNYLRCDSQFVDSGGREREEREKHCIIYLRYLLT